MDAKEIGPPPLEWEISQERLDQLYGERNWDLGKVFLVTVDKERPNEVYTAARPGVLIPDDYLTLEIEIERTNTILNAIFSDGKDPLSTIRSQQYFSRLVALARASLGQDQVSLGNMALKTFQYDVLVREAGRIKNKYVVELGKWTSIYGGVALIYYLFSLLFPIIIRDKLFSLIFVGSMLGAWLSFSIRNPNLTFYHLAAVEDDLLDPKIRPLFVGGMTMIVALLLGTEMVVVTIGGFDTKFLTSATANHAAVGIATMKALLIGCLCGISEQALPSALGQRAREFVGAIGGGQAASLIAGAPSGGLSDAEKTRKLAEAAAKAKRDFVDTAAAAEKARREATGKASVAERAKQEAAEKAGVAEKAKQEAAEKADVADRAKKEAAEKPSDDAARKAAEVAEKARQQAAEKATTAEKARTEAAAEATDADKAKQEAAERADAAEKAAAELARKASEAERAK